MQFQVEAVISRSNKAYVLARQLDIGQFGLGECPQFGGVSVTRSITQPRKLKADGSPELSVFAFHLASAADSDKFYVGQLVELSP